MKTLVVLALAGLPTGLVLAWGGDSGHHGGHAVGGHGGHSAGHGGSAFHGAAVDHHGSGDHASFGHAVAAAPHDAGHFGDFSGHHFSALHHGSIGLHDDHHSSVDVHFSVGHHHHYYGYPSYGYLGGYYHSYYGYPGAYYDYGYAAPQTYYSDPWPYAGSYGSDYVAPGPARDYAAEPRPEDETTASARDPQGVRPILWDDAAPWIARDRR